MLQYSGQMVFGQNEALLKIVVLSTMPESAVDEIGAVPIVCHD